MILFIMVDWSQTIYPNISPIFSGGRTAVVQFTIKDNVKPEVLTGVGVNVNQGVTGELKLLDETSNAIIVLLDNNRAVKIDRSLICILSIIAGRAKAGDDQIQ